MLLDSLILLFFLHYLVDDSCTRFFGGSFNLCSVFFRYMRDTILGMGIGLDSLDEEVVVVMFLDSSFGLEDLKNSNDGGMAGRCLSLVIIEIHCCDLLSGCCHCYCENL